MNDFTHAERCAVRRAVSAYRKVVSWRREASQRGGGNRAGGHRGMYRGVTPFDVLEKVALDEHRLGVLADAVIEMATEGD